MSNPKQSWLQCGEVIVYQEDLPALLSKLSLMPIFLRRLIEYQSAQAFIPTIEEQTRYQQSFLARERITDDKTLVAWLSKAGLTEDQMSKMLYQSLRVQQFKVHKYKQAAELFFLENKHIYDRVTYSLIRVSSRSQAVELHLRLEDDEATFAELAGTYSEGLERDSNGQIGPIELGITNPFLAERLRVSKEGQLWPPFEVDNWWIILRLEKHLPSQYDPNMQQKIIDKLYEAWILDQVKAGMDSLFGHSPADSKAIESDDSSLALSSDDSGSETSEDVRKSANVMSSLLSKLRGKL